MLAETSRVIQAYDDLVVKWYCIIRFQIIRLRILEEIEQYIPRSGRILDIGCGFGLFSLFFALCSKERRLFSIDLNVKRIMMARKAAAKLGLEDRVSFENANVLDYPFDNPMDGIFMLDIVHHLPRGGGPEILRKCFEILKPGGVLIVKDVDAKPLLKKWFTLVLDKLVDPIAPVSYYHREDLRSLLQGIGFDVKVHQQVDVLPYPHVLFVCRRKEAA